MKTNPSNPNHSLANKLQALEGGFDPERADALLDELFRLAEDQKTRLSLVAAPGKLQVLIRDALVCERPVRLAPAKLRSLCARLVVRCREWTGQDIPLHGADLETAYPGIQTRFHICLENKGGNPQIELKPISASGEVKADGKGVQPWKQDKAEDVDNPIAR